MSASDGIAPDLARIAPLRCRMAAIYGVEENCVLPVRGFVHAIELVLRCFTPADRRLTLPSATPAMRRLATLYNADLNPNADHPSHAIVKVSPGQFGMALGEDDVRALRGHYPEALLVIDERDIETAPKPSLALSATRESSLAVYREITTIYGVTSSVCGALIASAALIKRFINVLEPEFLHPKIIDEAQSILAPQRLTLLNGRITSLFAERARLVEKLEAAVTSPNIRPSDGPQIIVNVADIDLVLRRARVLDAPITRGQEGLLCVAVGDAAANDRTLAAFGVPENRRAPRFAEVVRETKETKIAVRVDLDRANDILIDTGIGYFDHMLEQIAGHGGFSLRLACIGDRHVDLHHTIEDSALALGSALSQALGERRGISRYGFLLPMDEAEAKASIDLGGRPYAVFEGAFSAPLIGDYPTEMTSHVFRSLAQSLGAAIHIEVKGENDHHKTEAAFKAFARALRAAIAVDGDAIPSTKGVIG